MSNLVLYRKYRPQTFGQVVSQEHVKTTLSNAVANNRVGHAYLFTGPRGVGKTTLARIFARAINCPNRKGSEPCNECEICKSFLEGTSLDLLEIDAASHTGVDNIRELIDHLQFAPTRAAFKVIIIDEVHMLSKGAFNALLKTLEEPPKHAVFILATTEVHKLPATIVSRTQRFDFKKVSIADLVKLLKYVAGDNNVKITEGALAEIAAGADGSFRDSLSLLDQVINYSDGEITEELAEEVLGLTGIKTNVKFLDLLVSGNAKDGLNFISDLLYAGRDLYQFEKDFLEYLRKVLLIKVGAKSDFGFSSDVNEQIKSQADKIELTKLMRIIEIFQKAEGEIKWATIQSLPLELAVVESCEGQAVAEAFRPPQDGNLKVSATDVRKSEIREDNIVLSSDALEKVVSNWAQILEKVKDYNHSLISSLKLAQPVAVQGDKLILLFPYKFHKDAIEARKNRIIIDQVIEEVTGMKILVKPLLQKEWVGVTATVEPEVIEPSQTSAPVPDSSDDTVESALKIFGGQKQ